MRHNHDIDRYVKDPNLLVALCREVIDQLDSGDDDAEMDAMEAQLREISRTIDRLGKSSVPVPDVLRAEKTRLAAALCDKTGTAALNHLADDLAEILKDLKHRLGQAGGDEAQKKPRSKRPRSPKTSQEVLREHVIRALKKLGGRARVPDVIKQIGHQLEDKLLPGDMEWRETTKEYAWQNNAKWERYQMTQDGVLRSDSPRGVWELSEDHR